jgi:hypothetical protein
MLLDTDYLFPQVDMEPLAFLKDARPQKAIAMQSLMAIRAGCSAG